MKYPAQMRLALSTEMKAEIDAQANSQQFVRDAIAAALAARGNMQRQGIAPQAPTAPRQAPSPVKGMSAKASVLVAYLEKRGEVQRRKVKADLAWSDADLGPIVLELKGKLQCTPDTLALHTDT